MVVPFWPKKTKKKNTVKENALLFTLGPSNIVIAECELNREW